MLAKLDDNFRDFTFVLSHLMHAMCLCIQELSEKTKNKIFVKFL
jgi:hypothetical protein